MGDLNARVRRDVKAWGEVIGRHGEETKNRNGQRLLSACAANELVILNTFFQHKDIHKYTWESRGRGLRTIIDYFVVRKALRAGVADVKVIRGAEVGSDHYLVLMKLKLKIRKQRKPEKSIQQKLRLNKLMEKEVTRKFQRELDIRLRQRACKREEGVENTWQGFRDTIKDVAEKVIGRSRKRRQRRATSWWNEEVKTAVRRKKELYNRALREKSESVWEDYKTGSKEAKRVVREAKEEDWLRWGKELQKSFLENRRAFWKKINGKEEGHRLKLGVKSKDGTLLTENDEVKNRWKEYFRELFDCEEREIDTRTEAEEREEKVSDEITEDEVRRVIRKIKSGKASGVCGIQGELLKAGGEVTVKWLQEIYSMVWRTGVVPRDWRRAVIIPIHKKGSRKLCKNYRGVSLLSIPGKVFASILNNRVRKVTEDKVMEEQAGFRSGRGCAELIFVMRQLTEKMIEKGKKMYAVFVDLEKAYDKVCREELWEALRRYGVSGGLLSVIKSMYQASEACVRVDGEMSEWFEVKQGVRQGCPLSPWLFNIFLDMVVREARTNFQGGVKLDTCQVQVLLFADDTVLVTETEEDLEHNIRALQTAVKKHKLAVNWTKTNTMAIGRETTGCKVEVEGHNLENASEAVYLGVKFSEDGRMEGELERRIGMALSTFGAMKAKVFGIRGLSQKAKMQVYNAMVVPVMTYGCES